MEFSTPGSTWESSGALEEERKKPVVLTGAASQPEARRIEEAAAVATERTWEEAQRLARQGETEVMEADADLADLFCR